MACQELKFESLLQEKAEKCPDALDACWRYGRRYVLLRQGRGREDVDRK